MSDTVTAVKTTCKVRMKFAVVPEALVEGYLGGTGTDSLIEQWRTQPRLRHWRLT